MESAKSDSFATGNSDLDYWIWIIEYFAKFKTQLWMLHDVFEMAPKLPDDLGEHTNEMVAFRCLASLFDSDVVTDANSKIEFDSSHSCEHVLECIVDEIPLSELKRGAPGLSKWNLLPFIKSKLVSLPKCALEMMIEPRSDDKESEQQMADPKQVVQSSSRSQDESDGHVSSSLENTKYTCVECKESGKLLFCSGDGCEVMVHHKCLDSPPAYDDAANFYCSLCSFTCGSAEYLQSQDEVAKAKKKLVSFLTLLSQVNKKKKKSIQLL